MHFPVRAGVGLLQLEHFIVFTQTSAMLHDV